MLGLGCASGNRSENLVRTIADLNEEVILSDPFIHRQPSSKFIDYSPTATDKWFSKLHSYQNKFQELDTIGLSQQERLRFETVLNYVNHSIQRDSFRYHPHPISHLHGPHLDTPVILQARELASKRDMENYLDELNEIENQIGGLIDALEQRRKLGFILPSFINQHVIDQCDSLASLPAEEHRYYTTMANQLNAIGLIDPKSKSKYLGSCLSIVNESIIPAHKRLAAYLRQLEHASMSVAGVWQFPNGDDFYSYQLLWYTGLELNPNKLYQIGKLQLDSVESKLEELNLSDTISIDELFLSSTSPSGFSVLHRLNFPAFHGGIDLFKKSVLSKESSIDREKAKYLRSLQLATSLMLVDIGIHQKQWLREQATVFLRTHSTLTNKETTALVDEIVVYPGLFSSTSVGFMTLKDILNENEYEQFLNEMDALEPMQLKILQRYVQQHLN